MNYKLALAGLLVTVAMYVQLPLLPMVLSCAAQPYMPLQVAAVTAMPGIGVFALGCFSSYLVQHYRRNMVCIVALLALALCSYAMYYLSVSVVTPSVDAPRLLPTADGTGLAALLVVRFVQGAVFGLAQMVLSSTLVIDTCVSPRRTAANQAAAWFARFALALGPMLALFLLVYRADVLGAVGLCGSPAGRGAAVLFAFRAAMLVAVALCVVSAGLVMAVRFPFKAPEDIVPHVSSDRFFLGRGKWLFVNLALVMAAVGVLFCVGRGVGFYAALMLGLLLALLVERTFLADVDFGRAVQVGVSLVLMAVAVYIWCGGWLVEWGVPLLLGGGAGLSGARFLSLFITLSPHCRRGTAQSTFFLAWELGLYSGVFVYYALSLQGGKGVGSVALVLSFVALLMFSAFTNKWYVGHKTR